MNQECLSWETIELVDYDYDWLTVVDGKVYADADIESLEELEKYSSLTPNEVLEAVVEGLLLTEEDSLKNILYRCKTELDLLGIQAEWFKTDSETSEAYLSEFARLTIPGEATYCIKCIAYVCEYDIMYNAPVGFDFELFKIEESDYIRAYQAEIDKLKQLAAKFGYQLIPA